MGVNSAAAAAMAMAAMLMTTAASADARKREDARPADLAQAQPSPPADFRTFDIPPQSLVTALNVFGRQAGMQISIDESIARGVQVQGVSGTMRPEQALTMLLAGTGIVARFAGDRAVVLTKPQSGAPDALQLDPVQVAGAFPVPSQALIDNIPPPYAGGQVATGGQLGLLGNRGVMDTPFNQTNFTAKKAQDQQAKTIRDVLLDDPSVRPTVADGVLGNDQVRIRGFNVVPSTTTYNGLFGILPGASIMAELADRIEVLKGPSVMLNGMPPNGAIGGSINIVPKRAPDEALTQLTANYISDGQYGIHADVGRRFGPENQFGIRFNGVFRAGDTPVDWNTDMRGLASLGLDFRGERFRASVDLGYQYQYVGGLIPAIGLANNVALPWAPDARKNAGQPWGYQERKDLYGVFRGELDLTERITAYVAFGAHDFRLGYLAAGAFGGVTVSGPNGDATAISGINSEYTTSQAAEAGFRARVDTGPIGHEIAFAASSYQSENGNGFLRGPTISTNIYNPVAVANPNLEMPIAGKSSTSMLSSLALADTLSAADNRVQLTVGARLQRVAAANFNSATGMQTGSYDQSALSPSVALLFKPWENVSVYGNWIQGLQQGTIVGPTFANAGEIFPPFKTTQYEAGVKVNWGKLTTTASLFQISQPSLITNTASNTLVLGGEQVNQGLELDFFGEVAPGVRVLGGAMFLNAVLAKTQGGLTDGWIAPFSPGAQFNIAGEWDLPFVRGLTLTSRITYTGAQYIDTTFPRRSLPEWTRLDVGARYTTENLSPTGKPLTVRFNVENVLDNDYWATGGGANALYLGAPITFRLSLTSNF